MSRAGSGRGRENTAPQSAVLRKSGSHRRVEPSDDLFISLDEPADFPLRVKAVKRLLDVVASSLGLLLLSPVLLGVAIAVKVTSPGPVFFRQERLRHTTKGEDTTFFMIKFRSMAKDAEAKTGPVWAQKNDARITKVGKLIRKTRLDELPQLWNVLKGDMSLVGPRPERPHFTGKLEEEIPAYLDRAVALKPGITGFAQVSLEYDSSVDDVRRKLMFDLAYAAHLYHLRSYVKIELKILLKTVLVVFTGRGAH